MNWLLSNTGADDQSKKGIARRVYGDLYSKKTNKCNVVEDYYDASAVFENPLLLVETHKDIANQFVLLSTFFQSIKPEVHSVTNSTVAGNHHVVVIDAVIKYRLPIRLPPLPRPFFLCNLLPFVWYTHYSSGVIYYPSNEIALRIVSRFEFNELNKIVRHEDIWSIKDLIESLPLIGWIYAEVSRKINGLVTSGIVMLAGELAKEWNEWSV